MTRLSAAFAIVFSILAALPAQAAPFFFLNVEQNYGEIDITHAPGGDALFETILVDDEDAEISTPAGDFAVVSGTYGDIVMVAPEPSLLALLPLGFAAVRLRRRSQR